MPAVASLLQMQHIQQGLGPHVLVCIASFTLALLSQEPYRASPQTHYRHVTCITQPCDLVGKGRWASVDLGPLAVSAQRAQHGTAGRGGCQGGAGGLSGAAPVLREDGSSGPCCMTGRADVKEAPGTLQVLPCFLLGVVKAKVVARLTGRARIATAGRTSVLRLFWGVGRESGPAYSWLTSASCYTFCA
jgi:hypothetical protein